MIKATKDSAHKNEPIKITSILGNSQLLDGGAMFGNAPRALWQRWAKPDEKGRIQLACRSMLIEHGSRKILVETGIGAYMDPKNRERFGVVEDDHLLLSNLAKAGYAKEAITDVILSHLHFDHAGGLLPAYPEGEKGDIIFPNAHFYVSQSSFERSLNPHERDRASFIKSLPEKLKKTGRLHLIEPEESCSSLLPDFLSFFHSHGHTPGLLLPIVKGAQRSIVFLADLIPGSAWVHLPITMGYDRYPELLINEKKALYEKMAAIKWLGFFTHDFQLAAASIEKEENGRFMAKDGHKALEQFIL